MYFRYILTIQILIILLMYNNPEFNYIINI